MVRKNFNSFVNSVDRFVKNEITKQNNFLANNALIYGSNYNVYKGVPNASMGTLSTIRDPEDNVMYFMVGIDRVGSVSKIGV